MQIFETRSLNIEAFFRTAILAGLGLFFALTLISGEALIYVNPKMLPFIKFGAITMGLLAVISALDIFTIPRQKVRLTTYTLFGLALALALIFPPTSIGSGDLKGRQMEMGLSRDLSAAADQNNHLEPGTESTGIQPEGEPGFQQESPPGEEGMLPDEPQHEPGADPERPVTEEGISPKPDLEDGNIVVDEQNFLNWLYILYRDAEEYRGTEIEITGFVFRDEEFEQNQFVLARFIMVCCIADMQLAGLMCRYEGAQELQTDEWVSIRGHIEEETFLGEKIPVIIPEEIIPAEKPEIPYIYP